MAAPRDPEKGADLENGTTGTGSTAYNSDNEKAIHDGTTGEPDIDHEEAEQMDQGHLDDLERERVSIPIPHSLDSH